MKKRLAILALIALSGLVFVVLFSVKKQEPEKKVFLEKGERAPAFTLTDMEGRVISLEELVGGSPLYIIFWSSSCVSCKDGMEVLEKAYRKYGKKGFRLVGVNIYQSAEEVRGFVKDVGITFNVLLDKEGTSVDKYNIYFVPVSYIISADGKVLDVYAGNPTEEDLEKVVERYWQQ